MAENSIAAHRTIEPEQPVILYEVSAADPCIKDYSRTEVWRGTFESWWNANADGRDAFSLDTPEYRDTIISDLLNNSEFYENGFLLVINGELL